MRKILILTIALFNCFRLTSAIEDTLWISPPKVSYKLARMADRIAHKHGINKGIFARLVEQESNWIVDTVGDHSESHRTYGLCQIQVRTARVWLGWKGSDRSIKERLLNGKTGLMACAHILRRLQDRYCGSEVLAVMAFNSGQANGDYVQDVVLIGCKKGDLV